MAFARPQAVTGWGHMVAGKGTATGNGMVTGWEHMMTGMGRSDRLGVTVAETDFGEH